MNADDRIQVGAELRQFKEFTSSGKFPSPLIGLTITNSLIMQQAHNSFAPPDTSIAEPEFQESLSAGKDKSAKSGKKKSAKQTDDLDDEDYAGENAVYHFVSYIPKNGTVYELDGYKSTPVAVGTYTALDTWWDGCITAVRDRMDKYNQSEIEFNMQALVDNRMQVFQDKLKQSSVAADKKVIQKDISDEQESLEILEVENMRRRHDYFDVARAFMEQMANADLWTKAAEEE